uniref:Uncharacterized protein n=1 Tax=Anguilla anguilla TaxID=7936 RepID=A0A0E9TMF5_ANGAN
MTVYFISIYCSLYFPKGVWPVSVFFNTASHPVTRT